MSHDTWKRKAERDLLIPLKISRTQNCPVLPKRSLPAGTDTKWEEDWDDTLRAEEQQQLLQTWEDEWDNTNEGECEEDEDDPEAEPPEPPRRGARGKKQRVAQIRDRDKNATFAEAQEAVAREQHTEELPPDSQIEPGDDEYNEDDIHPDDPPSPPTDDDPQQPSPREEQQVQNPDTATILPNNSPPKTQQTKNLFPRYAWQRNPDVTKRKIILGEGPTSLGVPKHKNSVDKKYTQVEVGVHLFEPIKWYLTQLEWEESDDIHSGTTNAELALDFEVATGVPLQRPSDTGPRTLRERANTFAAAARRVAQLCGNKPPAPGLQSKYCTSLVPLEYKGLKGFHMRARLLHLEPVAAALAQPHMYKLGGSVDTTCLDFIPKWIVPPGPSLWHDTHDPQPQHKATNAQATQGYQLQISGNVLKQHGITEHCEARTN